MESYEKEHGVNVENALGRLESSDEALDLEKGEVTFVDKWANDSDLKDWIASYAEDKEGSETKAVLQACIAAGGAGLAMFGVHDDLAQYMKEDTFFLADQITSRIAGGATMVMASLASWQNFKDSFKKGEKINRLRNQEA